MARGRKSAILAIFLHYMQQKWDQWTLTKQRLTLIGSRTRLGPIMDPAMVLQYTKHGPLYIGYMGQYSRFSPAGHLPPPPCLIKDSETPAWLRSKPQ